MPNLANSPTIVTTRLVCRAARAPSRGLFQTLSMFCALGVCLQVSSVHALPPPVAQRADASVVVADPQPPIATSARRPPSAVPQVVGAPRAQVGSRPLTPTCGAQVNGAVTNREPFEVAVSNAPLFQMGVLAQELVPRLLAEICGEPAVRAALPATCGSQIADKVQAHLTRDLLRLPKRRLASQLAALHHEQRVALELLDALSYGVRPGAVAERVVDALGYGSPDYCGLPHARVSDPLSVSLALVWSVSQVNEATSEARDETELGERLYRVLEGVYGVEHGRGALVRQGVASVAHAAALAHASYAALRSNPNLERLADVFETELRLYELSLSLVASAQIRLPIAAIEMLRAVARADLRSLSEASTSWLLAQARVDTEVVRRANDVRRLLQAQSRDEAERIVRGLVLGIGPWSDHWLVSVNAGIPQTQADNVSLIGSGQLGYHDRTWGLAGGGGASIIEFEDAGYVASTAKFFGNGDVWFGLPLGRRTVVELRASFDAVIFDGETTVIGSDAIVNAAETTRLLRASGLLGLRYQTSELGVGFWAGGGLQLEDYDQRTTTVLEDEIPTQQEELSSSSSVLQGRARLQWTLLPQWLTLRVTLDGRFYRLARVTDQIDTTSAQVRVVTDESAQQIDATGRAYIALEAARFFEFVPEVGAGVDHYQLAVEGHPTRVATIPVYVAGIRRTAF